MTSNTKLALVSLFILFFLVILGHFSKTSVLGIKISENFVFNYFSQTQDGNLERIVKKHLSNKPGQYAVVIKSLKPDDHREYRFNDNVIFPAASFYKLFLISSALEEVEKGKLKKDQVIVGDLNHLEKVLGFVDFGYEDIKDEKIEYSVAEILTRVSSVSDNYASIMLAEKLGWKNIQDQTKKIGASSTTIKNPISTTASDVALYFEKLYRKEVVSLNASDEIINLLSKSKINNRIPAKLPKEVKVSHKTGELARLRYDAGLVFLNPPAVSADRQAGGPYLIVLMSKDLKYEDDGVETLSNISKDVFEYFNK